MHNPAILAVLFEKIVGWKTKHVLLTAQQNKSMRKGYQLKKVFYFNQTLARDVIQETPQTNTPASPISPSQQHDPTNSHPLSHQLELLDLETNKIYRFAMKTEGEKKETLSMLQDAIYTQTFVWSEERSNIFNWFNEGMAAVDPMVNMALCYRSFQTPMEFLDSLEARISQQTAGPDHLTVEILHTFMETIKRTDVMDDTAAHQMHERLMFLILKVSNLAAKTYLLHLVDSLKFVAPKTRRHALKIGEQPTPDKSINRISVALQGFCSSSEVDKRPGISPKEVAEEITQTEWNILRAVSESELLNTSWSKSNASEIAPNILAFIDRFNWTSRWISSKILRRDTPKKRADTLSSYIEMGSRFKELNNFNGIMEVLSSLHSTPISRLKETWALLTPQQNAEFQALTDLMKLDKNSQTYRETLAAVDIRQPCMPYLGLFLSDLTFIEEANSKRVNGEINPNYTSLMGTKLRMFKSYQKRKYQLMKPLYSIYGELVFGEAELYKLSKLREEGSSAPPDAATRRSLLARSDSRRAAVQKDSGLGEDENIAVEKFLSKRDWQILLANAEALNLKKGDVLVGETDTSSNLYLVNAGNLKINLRDGRTMDVGPGEVCSKTSLLGDSVTETIISSIVAFADSTVSSINLTFLFRLFDTEFDLAARFFKYVANQLNGMLRHLMATYARGTYVNHRRSVNLTAELNANLNDSDKMFSTNFKALGNEVVVKSYACKLGILSGSMYITKNYLCFSAKAFGLNKKKVIQLASVTDIKSTKGVLEIMYDAKKNPKKFVFRNDKELEDCLGITTSLWESARSRQVQPSRIRSESGGGVEEKERGKGFLTPDDWKLILKGTKCITCDPGTELITEGVRPGALYQIVKGCCNIQVKSGDSRTMVIASRKEGDIFGELSFLDEEQAASASVVTAGPVEVYVLDYNYMHIMLSVYKYLAPRFYKYIARLLWDRILQFLGRMGSSTLQ
eukprot:Phypoly_transcript_00252.p1 GENE.Phypoly_transcript_00252~~Phypoly_transcript_00252.p1  ORF type:complete len:967 (+),score=140.75 Phypoly_transcript_00252:118-3018(+)